MQAWRYVLFAGAINHVTCERGSSETRSLSPDDVSYFKELKKTVDQQRRKARPPRPVSQWQTEESGNWYATPGNALAVGTKVRMHWDMTCEGQSSTATAIVTSRFEVLSETCKESVVLYELHYPRARDVKDGIVDVRGRRVDVIAHPAPLPTRSSTRVAARCRRAAALVESREVATVALSVAGSRPKRKQRQ